MSLSHFPKKRMNPISILFGRNSYRVNGVAECYRNAVFGISALQKRKVASLKLKKFLVDATIHHLVGQRVRPILRVNNTHVAATRWYSIYHFLNTVFRCTVPSFFPTLIKCYICNFCSSYCTSTHRRPSPSARLSHCFPIYHYVEYFLPVFS